MTNTREIHHKHWVKLGLRAFDLYVNQEDSSKKLVTNGYNEIAFFYDTYWTKYVHHLSETLLKRLPLLKGGDVLDLTCGTGYVTFKLYEMTGGNVTGVDASEGMIEVAQKRYGDTCHFIQNDVLEFLSNQPSQSYDVVTCAWGLGYLPVHHIMKEISRVLRPGGKIGIIDNSIFSNWKPIWFLCVALSEEPSALKYLMKPYFLSTTGSLTRKMRLNGISIIDSWNGKKIFTVNSKDEAIDRLIKSGVTAGFVQIIDERYKERIMNRIGELLQRYYATKDGIPIIHRYIAAIGEKKSNVS